MRISYIVWDDDTVAHIARHGVELQDVEDVCFDAHPHVFKAKYGRYIALGQTGSGRYLAVIFEYPGKGRAKVITARAMSEAEKRIYKRR